MTEAPDSSVLVVVPAMNEEATVGAVVADIRRVLAHADLLVIDDGSTDRTVGEARRSGALVLSLPYNLGVGGALRVGYRYAWRFGYDAVVQIDADGQHNPHDIPALLDALEDADLVIGARFAGVGNYEVSFARRLAMRMLARRVSRLAGVGLTDVTSGFRASGPRTIQLFARIYPVEYIGATVEALVIAARTGLRIGQVPVAMRLRSGGAPSHGFARSVVYVARVMAAITLSRVQRWPPAAAERDERIVPDPSQSAGAQ